MKIKILLVTLFAAMAFTACDDTTDTLGDTLTNSADKFDLDTDTFGVMTRSVAVDSVLAFSSCPYIGHVKDSETNTYVTSHFSSQFGILPTMMYYFPKEDSLRCEKDENGNYIAENCYLNIYFNSYTGDTLNTMKFKMYELQKPLEEGINYYSNFDPLKEGYARNDGNEIGISKSYTYEGLLTTDSMRPITIDLNGMEYERDGVKYKGYGSYILNMVYRHPEYFSSAYNFIHNVCPGFYFRHTSGVGNMGEIAFVRLAFNFKALNNDTLAVCEGVFPGTEEVMQTTFIEHDRDRIASLTTDNSCTYLKSPSGIFTEMELPIDQIKSGHENDTISSAKVVLSRYNYTSDEDVFSPPSYVLMLPKDSVYKFFEDKNVPDSKMSYLASFSSSSNTYTFNNISDLVNTLWHNKQQGRGGTDWNKVVIVPVNVNTNSSTSSSSTNITSVTNDMGLKSTRLVKGTNFYGRDQYVNGEFVQASPIKISVIYNKFRKE